MSDTDKSREIVTLDAQFLENLVDDEPRLAELRDMSVVQVQQQYGCNRFEARKLVKFAYEQEEEDNKSYAPSSTDYLESLLDTGIRDELTELLASQRELKAIIQKAACAGEDKNQKWKRKAGASVTGAEAKLMLEDLFSRILSIKKTLAASRPKDATNAPVTIDMGNLVGDIISNIKNADQS